MTKILLAGLIGTMVCVGEAGQFKLIDPHNPVIATGVYDNLRGGADAGGALAILTYKAGSVELVPLAAGATLGRGLGGPSVALGASANVLPPVKAGFRLLLATLYPDSAKFANLKAILSPPPAGQPDVTMAIGPAYSLVFYDGIKSKAMLTVFVGAEWRF